MQTLSQSVFILAFVLPPTVLMLGTAPVVLVRRRPA
jgi:hypothetical protein